MNTCMPSVLKLPKWVLYLSPSRSVIFLCAIAPGPNSIVSTPYSYFPMPFSRKLFPFSGTETPDSFPPSKKHSSMVTVTPSSPFPLNSNQFFPFVSYSVMVVSSFFTLLTGLFLKSILFQNRLSVLGDNV